MEEKTCYSVPNPYFLSDRFVYAHHKELGTVYIKLNGSEEIEEIGVDIVKRMHNTPLDKIKKLWGCREANEIEQALIEHIGEEYWSYIYRENPYKEQFMNKKSKLNLNAGDYAISHCDSDKTYNGLEVHKMLCDAYIAGNNDILDDEAYRKAYYDGYNKCNRDWIYSQEAEKEKYDFVSGQFIECRKSFNGFKEDNSYWLEYIGDDNYIGRSDNILNQKFHITPRQLFTLFTWQHRPKENNVNEETNAPTGYGKYVDECLYEASKHFFSEGEDKYSVADLFYAGVRCGKSWLERQGEHANFRNKIQVGDKVTRNEDGVLVNLSQLKRVAKPSEKQGEQNLVLRDTFGYEDGRLFGMNEGIGLVLDNPEKYGLQKPVKWSKEDENVISLILSICNDFLESFEISPASTKVVKEDVDKIENWLKSLKPQNTYNPYKAVVESIAEMCKHYDKASHSGLRDFYDNVKVKCKDAKEYDKMFPQAQWKPSDEQIECLSDAIEHYNSLGYPASKLKELLDDLKKIKEE